jgi:hypothetical protein
MSIRARSALLTVVMVLLAQNPILANPPQVDLTGYPPDAAVTVQQVGSRLVARWPGDSGRWCQLDLELNSGSPLITAMSAGKTDQNTEAIVRGVDPVWLLTVGTRDLHQSAGWVAFFDDPPKRPHQTYRASRDTHHVRVSCEGHHTIIALDGLKAGPFEGELRFTIYPRCPLIQAEAILSTSQDSCAILYDTGLASASPVAGSIGYVDDHDQWHHLSGADGGATPVAVRHRTIIAESAAGCVAVFPLPHQYFYPLDEVDNFGFVWHGKGYRDLVDGFGLGIRQPLEGDGRHVPWVNAPPGTQQHLGVFYLLSDGDALATAKQVNQYTRDDHFKHLDGFTTFTSHYHVEDTHEFLAAQQAQHTQDIPTGMQEPDFVKRFKKMGVDIAHLAEFHYDWSKEKLDRLQLLMVLHGECRRLSDPSFLLLPGEEPNVHLGGHWISLFPKPVYWTLDRKKDQPFAEQIDGFGTVYHVGSSDDVLRLMQTEHGLMWTAHPRIKASFGFPDAYRHKDFFLSDRFLGGAWKAMPADDSLPRLGSRVLDLLDDFCNWGLRKYTPGEVDVFRILSTSELYGHMNVNYLQLRDIPRFDTGWQPVLDTLSASKFFVTTGEVLIPSCTFAGKGSGEVLHLNEHHQANLIAQIEGTFPLSFAEVVSGDGHNVYRQRIELNDTDCFAAKRIELPVDLNGRKWVRFEVWDVARNGAFTQPFWIE